MDLFPNGSLFVHDICQKIGKDFVSSDFVRAVRTVGKLAWQTLMSENPMFRKGELGLEVFTYGLLIGDEDPEGLSDETADILVTFAHRSIQEFFGAFYFILSLSEGETIVSLLGGDCEKPIFLTNPLFLEFCLWLIHSTELTSFPWKVETVREPLVAYLVGKIDKEYFDLKRLCSEFPALHMAHRSYWGHDVIDRNRMVFNLMKDVLSQCSKIESLALDNSCPVDELLSAVDPSLWHSQIYTLQLCEDFSDSSGKPEQPERELLIYLHDLQETPEMLRVALKYCYRAERHPCVRINVAGYSLLELSELFQINDIRQLHVHRYREGACVTCYQDIASCPSLRQFSVHNWKRGDDVLSALRKAIQRKYLPNLNHLSLWHCSFNREGILRYLFRSRNAALEHLNLEGVKLNKSDLQFISELRTLQYLSLSIGRVQSLFQNPGANAWATLSVLRVCDIDSEFLEGFVRAVNENKLPNLEKLDFSNCDNDCEAKSDAIVIDISLFKLQAEKLPSLKHLTLAGFIFSVEDIQDPEQKVLKWNLEFFRIFRSKGTSGHLSVLFHHHLPSLTDLKLRLCELTSDDMHCLTEAREQGRLPKLEYLDVSANRIEDPEMWIKNEAWKNVEIDDYDQKLAGYVPLV